MSQRARTVSTEVTALRRRIHTLEDEAEIARRLADFEDQGPGRTRVYRFIERETGEFTVALLCRVCRVSRSAYYAWRATGERPDDDTIEEAQLANTIFDVWRNSRARYGAPRVTAQLWRQGVQANEKRVARLMAELGIAGISGRRKVRTTRRDPSRPLAPDLLERDFSADAPDELWLTDINYIPTDEGWLYLCSMLDCCTRLLLGWSIAEHMRTELCLDALASAANRRGRVRFVGTVLHSDHGCQYTSELFNERCRAMGVIQSMGTVGDSYDNAMAESLWSSLKRELVDNAHFSTKEEAILAVFEWIVWYNAERLHSSIGYMPPIEYEESLKSTKVA